LGFETFLVDLSTHPAVFLPPLFLARVSFPFSLSIFPSRLAVERGFFYETEFFFFLCFIGLFLWDLGRIAPEVNLGFGLFHHLFFLGQTVSACW